MLENFQLLLQILYYSLGILIVVVSFLIPLVKNAKAKKALKTTLDIATAIRPYVIEAEKFVNYTGAEKLNYVMTKANQYAIENGLKFDAEATKKEIEELIELTKQVNKREKDEAYQAETIETAEVTSK